MRSPRRRPGPPLTVWTTTATLLAGAVVGGVGVDVALAPTASAAATTVCSAGTCTVTFDFEGADPSTGQTQVWTVPSRVQGVRATLYGAASASGQRGARVVADVPAFGGTTIFVQVGGAGRVRGGPVGLADTGGWNGGGDGYAGGAGGATDLRIGGTGLESRVLVAGGAGADGGTSYCYISANPQDCGTTQPGGAGGTSGASGAAPGTYRPRGYTYSPAGGGGGGLDSSGGSGGTAGGATGPDVSCYNAPMTYTDQPRPGTPGSPGELGIGAPGGTGSVSTGGAGGGGYYGGGAGGNGGRMGTQCPFTHLSWAPGGGGGGGSSYVDGVTGYVPTQATVTDGVATPGGTSNGQVVITYADPDFRADVLYVSGTGRSADDCLTPQTACTSVAVALSKASADATIHLTGTIPTPDVPIFSGTRRFVGDSTAVLQGIGGSVLTVGGSAVVRVTDLVIESPSTVSTPNGLVRVLGGSLIVDRITVTGRTTASGALVSQSGGSAYLKDSVLTGAAIGIDSSSGVSATANSTIANVVTGARTTGSGAIDLVNTSVVSSGAPVDGGGQRLGLLGSLLDSPVACEGTVTDAGYNVAAGACALSGTSVAEQGQQTGRSVPIAARRTLGVALTWSDSAAVDRIPLGVRVTLGGSTILVCSGSGTDQRGLAAPQGPACDSGAVELEASRVILTPSATTVPRNTPVTLRAEPRPGPALLLPNAQGTVTFTQGTGQNVTTLCTVTGVRMLQTATCEATLSGTGDQSVTATYTSREGFRASSATTTITITTISPLEITTAALADVPGAAPASFSLSATGGDGARTWSLTSGALPAGLTLTATGASAGTISGTPTAYGTYPFGVSVTDGTRTATRSLSLRVTTPTLALGPTTLTDGVVGTPYDVALTPSGGTAPYTLAVTAGALPAGLRLENGRLVGTPTAVGTGSFTIRVTDAGTGAPADAPAASSRTLSLTVVAGTFTGTPTVTVTGSGVVRSTLVATLPALSAWVPDAQARTVRWQHRVGGAGAWTDLPGRTGTSLTLSPAEVAPGDEVRARVTPLRDGYAGGITDSAPVTVRAPTITVSPATLPDAAGAAALNRQITGGGGTGPYAVTVVAGDLPDGLMLSATGTLTGTPTRYGPASFTVRVTDADGFSAERAYTLLVADPILSITSGSLPGARVDAPYSVTLAGQGGTAPRRWSATGLPPGLSLTDDGVLSGTPSTAGSFSPTFRLTDSGTGTGPATVTGDLPITIAPGTFDVTPTPVLSTPVRVGVPVEVSGIGTTAWLPAADDVTVVWQVRRSGSTTWTDVATGGPSTSYTPVVSDALGTLRVLATASRSGYTPATAESASSTIALGRLQVLSDGTPTFGRPVAQDSLQAAQGPWTVIPSDGATTTLTWEIETSPGSGVFEPLSSDVAITVPDRVGAALRLTSTISVPGHEPVSGTSRDTIVAPFALREVGTLTLEEHDSAAAGGSETRAEGPTPGDVVVHRRDEAFTLTPDEVACRVFRQRDGESRVAGGIAPDCRYTLTPADIGATVWVSIGGLLSGYSAVEDVPAAGFRVLAPFDRLPRPRVAGIPRVGAVLQATRVATSDFAPTAEAVTLTWQRRRPGTGTWQDVGEGATYRPGVADLRRVLRVVVTGRVADRATSVVASPPTTAVSRGTGERVAIALSGQARVGARLTARVSSALPPDTRVRWRWSVDGFRLRWNRPTLRLQRAWAGQRVVVRAVVTSPGYRPAVSLSRTTARIRLR